MPLPEDEAEWANHHILFATEKGGVRRNLLSDFRNIRANGLIAMKFEDDGDALISVKLCKPEDTVLLSTVEGKCIRFPVEDVRVFSGRTSTGVRGVRLAPKDSVVSMAVLRHVEASPEERAEYLRRRNAEGRGDAFQSELLSDERYAAMAEGEQRILTVTERGMGKISSAYDYRVSGRGGQGIWALQRTDKTGPVVACFCVEETDQVMLVTDQAKLIRLAIKSLRIMSRQTQGVRLFHVAKDEHVVSVAWLSEQDEDEEGAEIATPEAPPADEPDADIPPQGDEEE
jgi:DNA gyrase subunit A